jgi:hypothetical protein
MQGREDAFTLPPLSAGDMKKFSSDYNMHGAAARCTDFEPHT